MAVRPNPPGPASNRTCAACNSGTIEDIHHFVMECPKYEGKRTAMLRQAVVEIARSDGDLSAVQFAVMPPGDQLAVLLG